MAGKERVSEEELKAKLREALLKLRELSKAQERTAVAIFPVHHAIMQMGEAIRGLKKAGAEVPKIDLTGIHKDFMSSFNMHPETKAAASWMRQLDLKEELQRKHGTREERARRLTKKEI